MSEPELEIKEIAFNKAIFLQLETLSQARNFWPIVYILNDGTLREAYVGETTDLLARMATHLSNGEKSRLTEAHFITSNRFNKSATLDIESNLIKYIAADGKFRLLNCNVGLSNHNYYQKQWYWELFKDIWSRLRGLGIARHSIKDIDNSALFKYSPYKSLTKDQKRGIILILQMLLNPYKRNIVLEGGAGTGKTVLALFLFKLLHTPLEEFNFATFGEYEEKILDLTRAVKGKYPDPQMALVVPMTSFRATLTRVFKNVKGLKPSMVVGPSDIAKKHFDIIIVDEAHRLRWRKSLTNYLSFDTASRQLGFDKHRHTELDWVLKQSDKTVLFYDKEQSIKPADVPAEQFTSLKARSDTIVTPLVSQLRVKGGNDYVSFVHRLLHTQLPKEYGRFYSKRYILRLCNSIEELIQHVKQHDDESSLSRMIAGFSWPWRSKTNPMQADIEIEGKWLKWNVTNSDWINSANAVNEVGCIHTTQGYDLNFAGIILGKEISYNEKTNEIVILKQHYYDSNGKKGVEDDAELKEYIIHIYKTLLLRAIEGCYVYVVDDKLRAYFEKHLPYIEPQPNEASDPADTIADKSILRIPLYNLQAAAGAFSNEQQVDNVDTVPLPSKYKSTEGLFACAVVGESMNKVIPNGSICLFRRDDGGSRNGKIVLVELTDMQDPDSGSYYTVKEYHSTKNTTPEGWQHATITLKPLTHAEGYKVIKLTGNEAKNLRVIGLFEQVL
ncbi:DNA/RNA helicase domain-containing protein [Compostibacter hankyongensis]|uniref:GIY-YIG domain-containing protein n=1 Tax=Compostibacter hankyongensis TaxID=1007089 RepID=A0ABP8G4X7_9BACT